uniref:Uncharacterized protein n=1 Tax=Strombidium inclinatum TaxID=197538 RepID=A0A7S3IZQ7_9SPIT|mmetsp:Transcript_9285/g.14061  ORF Transcript_9285/g.14061 Transcript_9285/m.14061 type:complete len:160 (+) Transcript_9285:26-505(+)
MTTLKLEGINVSAAPASAEGMLKVNGVRAYAQPQHEKKMLHEAARRIIFKKCFGPKCGLEKEELPVFDFKFYHEMDEAQECLESCYNARMENVFGDEYSSQNNLYMNMTEMKAAFTRFSHANPDKAIVDHYMAGMQEDKVDTLTASLINKSKGSGLNFH